MRGGILGNSGTINKTGNGDLKFNAGSSIAFAGTFNINAGKAIFSTNAYINVLNIASNTTLGLSVDFIGNLSSILYLDTININTWSNLFINTIAGSSIAVIYANNASQPNIFDNIISGNYEYIFDWTGTNNNWIGYLTLSGISIVEKTGKFLANSLSLAAKSNGIDDIYSRIEKGVVNQSGDVWIGLYGTGKTADEFSAQGFGGAFGIDIYASQNIMGGLFVRYGTNNMKEENNKGNMGEIEFGVYGGIFEISNSPINVKVNASAGIQSYSLEIGDSVDFDGKAIRGGAEIEYIAPISETTKLKPFIGIQGGLAMNDDIKTNAGTIKSDSLLRAEGKAGFGLSGQAGQNIKWHGRIYGIFLASGDEPKYKMTDNNGNETEAIGTKEENIQGAISLGLEYDLSGAISIFINGGAAADFGDVFGWTGGTGINYKFGIPKTPANIIPEPSKIAKPIEKPIEKSTKNPTDIQQADATKNITEDKTEAAQAEPEEKKEAEQPEQTAEKEEAVVSKPAPKTVVEPERFYNSISDYLSADGDKTAVQSKPKTKSINSVPKQKAKAIKPAPKPKKTSKSPAKSKKR
jgi:hypothetical protein